MDSSKHVFYKFIAVTQSALFFQPPDSRRPSARPPEVSEFIPLLPRTDHWEFPRDRLRLSTVLGSGAFGMVMRGDAQGIRGSSGSVKVAVKVAKGEKDLPNVFFSHFVGNTKETKA